jgi:RNA polymerase sigma factor (sigma-70 family)
MTGADESDESLIARYTRGDAAAFEQLYRRHEMSTWRYLHRAIRDRASADDLQQEVWFAVARDAARYQPTARFTAWLFGIAHHRLIDAIRARRGHLSLDAIGYDADPVVRALTAHPGAGPLEAAVARDEAALLSQALGQLPREQREALLLQLEGELTVEEIAAIMDSSYETTKSRLRYARTRLRELLAEHA